MSVSYMPEYSGKLEKGFIVSHLIGRGKPEDVYRIVKEIYDENLNHLGRIDNWAFENKGKGEGNE